jgi:glycosyltransferase involved in cell wall biosynthesis
MGPERNSEIRRLLVISFHFPPDGTIGGQRWAGLSKYLARAGWEVHVVTASPANSSTLPAGVHRHFRARRRTLNEVYRARFAERGLGQHISPVAIPGESGPPRRNALLRLLTLLRRIAGSAAGLPDHGRGWILRATGAARMLMRDNEFDCVISSGPPHSAHFAGLAATWDRNTNFWIDMRDPWSLTFEMNTPTSGFIRGERYVLERLERLILPRASRILVNTAEFASVLRASQPGLDVTHFPNGIDMEQLPRRDVSTVAKGTIAYVGTLYAGRNLSSVFAAMRLMLDERPEAAGVLRLNVAGPQESPHCERMQEEIDAAGLTSLVSVLGVLPRDGALDLLGRAHLALVLAQEQPMCVPAKLYESVGLGVPTLVIAEKESAAAREARRIGAMTVEGHDVSGIKSLLGDMLAGRLPTDIPPKTAISYEELAIEMDRLLREGMRERLSRRRRSRTPLSIAANAASLPNRHSSA